MVESRIKRGHPSHPQLKGINHLWTAFLNRRVCVTRKPGSFCTKSWLKEEVQKPLGLLSHVISLSPSRSCQGSQDRCAPCPWPGSGALQATWQPCPAHPRQVHFATPQLTLNSMELLIIFLCQTFVRNFIPKVVVYFPFGSICDSSK